MGFVLLTSIAASIVSGTTQAGATLVGSGAGVVSAAVVKSDETFSVDYYTDTLLRSKNLNVIDDQKINRQEVSTILTRSIVRGELSSDDKDHLIGIIAQRAQISEAEARARLQQVTDDAMQAVDTLETQAREAADAARKADAIVALWAFASLLLGAFVASFAATIGGRARDL